MNIIELAITNLQSCRNVFKILAANGTHTFFLREPYFAIIRREARSADDCVVKWEKPWRFELECDDVAYLIYKDKREHTNG